jgi:hypothetical protein
VIEVVVLVAQASKGESHLINLDNVELKYYNVVYTHTNHSVFKAKVVAFSHGNLTTQIESLLFNRYKRKLSADKAVVVEISENQFKGE